MDAGRLTEFDRALARRDVESCFSIARADRGEVPLDRLMRLAIVMSEAKDARYDALARRIVVRFVEEFEPRPLNIRKLADCLECLSNWFLGADADAGLQRLADRIDAFHAGRRSRGAVAEFRFEGRVEKLEWNP